MKRSLYPEGVEVHQRQLEYTESSKADEIRRTLVDTTTLGVVSGLTVTTNVGDSTLIDILSGHGFVPNGDAVELAVSQIGVSLADYGVDAKNYILLVYDETSSYPESHESDGTTRYVRATVTPRLVVLSAAAYAALPASSSVLSANAVDRSLLLAIVTSDGVGVGSIKNATTYDRALVTTQPVLISGVSVMTINPGTNIGTGTLAFTAASKQITWAAPGDIAGAPVVLSASGDYALTSSSGKTLGINVSYQLLPNVDSIDTISISDMYAQDVTRHTANDTRHRSLLGSGIPTSKNPHGLTIDDLGSGMSGSLGEHQDLMHSNGIWSGSSTSIFECIVDTLSAPDLVVATAPAVGDIWYINGRKLTTLSTSTSVSFAAGAAEPALYGIYIDQNGSIFKSVRAKFPDTGSSLLYSKIQIVNVSDDIISGTKNLVWTTAGKLQFDGGPLKDAPAASTMMRLYAGNRVSYIDVYVKNFAAPGVNQTDIITFTAEPPSDSNLPIAYVPWSGLATGFLGYGYGVANAPNGIYDRRVFGNISTDDVRTDALTKITPVIVDDLLGSGIAIKTDAQTTESSIKTDALKLGTVSALAIDVNGGVVYIGGNRLQAATTTLTLTDNTTNRIFIDSAGLIRVSTLSWADIILGEYDKPILKLWDITLAAGAETTRTDNRVYISHKRDAPMGIPSLDIDRKLSITPLSGIAITGISNGGAGAAGIVGIGTGASTPTPSGEGVVGVGATGVSGRAYGAGGIGVEGIPADITGYGIKAVGGSGDPAGASAYFEGGQFYDGLGSGTGGTAIIAKGGNEGNGGPNITGHSIDARGPIKMTVTNPDAYAHTSVLAQQNLTAAHASLTGTGAAPTVNNEYNVSSVTVSGNDFLVTFKTPLTLVGTYTVVVTGNFGAAPAAPYAHTRTTTTFKIGARDTSTGVIVAMSTLAAGQTIDFIVIGY